MVAPTASDLQIALRDALVFETGFLQQRTRRGVFGQTSGLNATDVQHRERVQHRRIQRLGHIALPREVLPHPVTNRARLGYAALDVIESYSANQVIIVAMKNQHV
jgi:hypothetical protein